VPLLRHGSLDYYDQSQLQTATVQIDGRSGKLSLSAGASTELRDPLGTNWYCASSGEWQGVFSEHLDSEGSVENVATTQVTIGVAVDGALVVHIIAENGATFPPGVDRREEWATFKRVR
jgi:hypothetical protein